MAQDWNIRPRGDTCRQCSTAFADGQGYTSALFFSEEGYVRGDYCDGCWQKLQRDGTPYSVWQGVYHAPPPAAEPALRKETAEDLIRRLIEEDDDAKLDVVFILAVMLERSRILVEKDVQKLPQGQLVRVYEHKKTGETFLIRDPQLNMQQLEAVQTAVIELLGGGPAAAATPTTPAAPPPEAAPAAD